MSMCLIFQIGWNYFISAFKILELHLMIVLCQRSLATCGISVHCISDKFVKIFAQMSHTLKLCGQAVN